MAVPIGIFSKIFLAVFELSDGNESLFNGIKFSTSLMLTAKFKFYPLSIPIDTMPITFPSKVNKGLPLFPEETGTEI